MSSFITTRPLRVFALLLLGFILVSCTEDDDDDRRYTASAPIEFITIRTSQTVMIVDAINGEVEIRGVAITDTIIPVTITGERRVTADSQSEAEEYLEHLQVRLIESPNGFLLETDQPDQADGRDYYVRYVIMIPEDMRAEVSQVNGNVTVEDLSPLDPDDWAADVNLTNGDAVIRDVYGRVNVNFVNGSAVCTYLQSVPEVNVIHGVNGTITLNVPDSVSATFSAALTNGTISVTGLDLQDAVYQPTSVTGVLGNGNGVINLALVNGTITVVGH